MNNETINQVVKQALEAAASDFEEIMKKAVEEATGKIASEAAEIGAKIGAEVGMRIITEAELAVTTMKNEKMQKVTTSYEARYVDLWKMFKDYRTLPESELRRKIVDRAILSYRQYGKTDNVKTRRCAILEEKYLFPQRVGNRKLAAKYYIHIRTVMRDVSDAIKDLMPLVYGIDGVEWADMDAIDELIFASLRRRSDDKSRV